MKTLVIFGSRRGTTKKCAEIMQETCKNECTLLDVKSKRKLNISEFERIIIGANAFSGKLNPLVRKYVRKNISILLKKELFLFICCGSTEKETVDALFLSCYPLEIINHAKLKENFGGCLKFHEESYIIRTILKKMGKQDYDTVSNKESIVQWMVSL